MWPTNLNWFALTSEEPISRLADALLLAHLLAICVSLVAVLIAFGLDHFIQAAFLDGLALSVNESHSRPAYTYLATGPFAAGVSIVTITASHFHNFVSLAPLNFLAFFSHLGVSHTANTSLMTCRDAARV